jgi:hypothetical protein
VPLSNRHATEPQHWSPPSVSHTSSPVHFPHQVRQQPEATSDNQRGLTVSPGHGRMPGSLSSKQEGQKTEPQPCHVPLSPLQARPTRHAATNTRETLAHPGQPCQHIRQVRHGSLTAATHHAITKYHHDTLQERHVLVLWCLVGKGHLPACVLCWYQMHSRASWHVPSSWLATYK